MLEKRKAQVLAEKVSAAFTERDAAARFFGNAKRSTSRAAPSGAISSKEMTDVRSAHL
jgi:hypothetical protein